jgi:hypothetical protein
MNQNTLNASVDDVRLVSNPATGERARLEAVQSQLIAILNTVTNSDDRKKLNEAIKKLGEADKNEYWDTEDHPTRDDGNKVFDKTRDAAGKLRELYLGAKTVSLRPQMLPLLTELKDTAHAIATREIDELAVVGPGSEDPAEAQKKLNEAMAELAKGDEDWSNNFKGKEAIDHYKHAWQKAIDKLHDISKEN